MTDMKHTPGPWNLRMHSAEESQCGEEGEWSIDAPNGKSLFGNERYYPYVSRNIADIHLIAAAPDLLDALKACEGFCDENGMVNGVNVRAAIAKAEGRDE